jgi:hypothetical protein
VLGEADLAPLHGVLWAAVPATAEEGLLALPPQRFYPAQLQLSRQKLLPVRLPPRPLLRSPPAHALGDTRLGGGHRCAPRLAPRAPPVALCHPKWAFRSLAMLRPGPFHSTKSKRQLDRDQVTPIMAEMTEVVAHLKHTCKKHFEAVKVGDLAFLGRARLLTSGTEASGGSRQSRW